MTREPVPALVAPDKFKGTLSAREVAAAIARGLRAAGREAEELPVADGGEGTVDALRGRARRRGCARADGVSDPLGRPVEARVRADRPDGDAAVVEMAQASGLALVRRGRARRVGGLDARHRRADRGGASRRAPRVIVAVGGTATTDGGAGALEALDGGGRDRRADVALRRAHAVRARRARLRAAEGRRRGDGASGSTRRLDELGRAAPRDPRGVPMTGAARRPVGRRSGRATAPRSCPAPPSCSTRSASTSACAPRRSSSPARAASTSRRSRARSSARWPPAAARRGGLPRVVGAIDLDPFASASSTSPRSPRPATLDELPRASRPVARSRSRRPATPAPRSAAAEHRHGVARGGRAGSGRPQLDAVGHADGVEDQERRRSRSARAGDLQPADLDVSRSSGHATVGSSTGSLVVATSDQQAEGGASPRSAISSCR